MSQYTLEEVERFTEPDPQLKPLFQASADYAEYQARYLMQGFGIRAAWEAQRQVQGGRGGRKSRGGRRGDGGRGGEGSRGGGAARGGGGAARGLHRKSVRMSVQHASSVGSREERPSKRQRHSSGTEEEPVTVSNETEEPTDIDLEDTSGSTMPKVTRTQEVVSSEAEEEVFEEDEEEGEGRDEDED
ncbi:U3 small nucleolar RNA-associated protein 25-like [Rhododendron vialii]|uniref:U3 small nucleolar RNA-associated protein 25-like n=1 Tax=Rhododendron vialii TaxID=182163 RepID=UPI00265E43B4|nr:U3 small nucleolar RNA-associated protein 25-like [Rhododendron vialii]